MSHTEARLPSRAMKVTTVRFGADLWALLEREAALAEVSVAQYVREAALARAAFAAGTRAGAPEHLLAAWSQSTLTQAHPPTAHAADTQRLIAALTGSQTRERVQEATAVRAEPRQARRKARQTRRA
jgi:hypothetical protein